MASRFRHAKSIFCLTGGDGDGYYPALHVRVLEQGIAWQMNSREVFTWSRFYLASIDEWLSKDAIVCFLDRFRF